MAADLESSDSEGLDLNNYKGMFYDDPEEKYSDPITGAHFEFTNICQRLQIALKDRRETEIAEEAASCKEREIEMDSARRRESRNIMKLKMIIREKQRCRENSENSRNGNMNHLSQQGYATGVVPAKPHKTVIEVGGNGHTNINKSMDLKYLRKPSGGAAGNQGVNTNTNNNINQPPNQNPSTHHENMKYMQYIQDRIETAASGAANTVGAAGGGTYGHENKLMQEFRDSLQTSQAMARRALQGSMRAKSNERNPPPNPSVGANPGHKVYNQYGAGTRGDMQIILSSKPKRIPKVIRANLFSNDHKSPKALGSHQTRNFHEMHTTDIPRGRESTSFLEERREGYREGSGVFMQHNKKSSHLGMNSRNNPLPTQANTQTQTNNRLQKQRTMFKKGSAGQIRTRNISNPGMSGGERKTVDYIAEIPMRSKSITKKVEEGRNTFNMNRPPQYPPEYPQFPINSQTKVNTQNLPRVVATAGEKNYQNFQNYQSHQTRNIGIPISNTGGGRVSGSRAGESPFREISRNLRGQSKSRNAGGVGGEVGRGKTTVSNNINNTGNSAQRKGRGGGAVNTSMYTYLHPSYSTRK